MLRPAVRPGDGRIGSGVSFPGRACRPELPEGRIMGERTQIEWTDATWNPTTGCTKVSRACDNCHAHSLANGRLKDVYCGSIPFFRRRRQRQIRSPFDSGLIGSLNQARSSIRSHARARGRESEAAAHRCGCPLPSTPAGARQAQRRALLIEIYPRDGAHRAASTIRTEASSRLRTRVPLRLSVARGRLAVS